MNHAFIEAAPEEVFAVLETPERYAEWVVGPRVSGAPDPAWPAPGSCFRHKEGRPPFEIQDVTEVLEIEPPRRMSLRALLRPLAVARIDITLAPDGAGTLVRMVERCIGGPARLVPHALLDVPLRWRNARSLARLAELATRGA